MADIKDYTVRPQSEIAAEQSYLRQRMAEIEKGMGRVAARGEEPTALTQPMDALDRARELVGEMIKQVQVRTLEEAVQSRLAWLDRVEERQEADATEPKPAFNRIALDRRLVQDLLTGWEARQN